MARENKGNDVPLSATKCAPIEMAPADSPNIVNLNLRIFQSKRILIAKFRTGVLLWIATNMVDVIVNPLHGSSLI